LKFSHNAVIGPYGDINGLMIRLTPFKNTNFTDAEAKITLGMSIEENGKLVNKFYTLDLELEKLIHFELDSSSSITEDSRYFNSPKMILPITMEKLFLSKL
jgi:inward rectifier potassium channel